MAMMKAIQELEDTDKGTMEDKDRFFAWLRGWNGQLEWVEPHSSNERHVASAWHAARQAATDPSPTIPGVPMTLFETSLHV